jgi:SNF2 family DNA or RNA helicase
LDNYRYGSVGNFLSDAITPESDIAIVSAYFTIYAYAKLKKNFDAIDHLKFLFGEPTFIRSVKPDGATARSYKFEDDTLHISSASQLSQKTIAKECAAWLKEKAEIRSMVKPNFLHGKMYHIHQKSGIEKAIVGSSNFTVHGLGLGHGEDKNIELNMVVDSDRDRQELKAWFDSIWDDDSGLVEDVKAKVLEYLEQLCAENAPEFIYFKTLFHIFGDYLDEQKSGGLLDEASGFYDTEIWGKLYDFQKDGVKGAINKILKHNGCIIADSVGLGKTFEALAVIKYFELRNEKVLVICPKKLTGNWTVYQASQNNKRNPFKRDRFNYSVLYHTDIGRTSGTSSANGIDLNAFNWGVYDLIVIDESHNFRGNPSSKENDGGDIKFNRAAWLMEKIIKAGAKTKVLMLSATPVNNDLRDIRNQIYYITEGNDSALFESCNIKSIEQTLKIAQNNFTRWAGPKNNAKKTNDLLEKLDSSFFKLLDELTIARSRKHIINFYDINAIGSFPHREKPIAIYPEIDTANRFPSYDTINKRILEYKLSIFNPSAYVKEDKKSKYEKTAGGKVQFSQGIREHFLIGMMKVNFLKRLESSIESFEISLDRTIRKIEDLQSKINAFITAHGKTQQDEGLFSKAFSVDDYAPNEDEIESEDADAWIVGKKLQYNLADLDLERWLKDLRSDKDALVSLHANAGAVTVDRDAKLAELKCIIADKVKKPFNDANKKIIVFTAFSDTAHYLYENIEPWATKELHLHSALVFGSGSKTTFGENNYDNILTNFSPRSKERDAETSEEIDVLIATDCISEGQNLQDCDFLVNYDIHWNPVRIIQRFGRIDRIGSKNKNIKLVNFWPTKDLDAYINLKTRVEARMALVDVTATADDNLLKTDQTDGSIFGELLSDGALAMQGSNYRDKQLKQLQSEILDLEDMDESISLTDFTLDDFRVELSKYINQNKQKLEKSPYGLYAVVPSPSDEYSEIIKPGVIFCLAQKIVREGNESVNPLNPFFLIYIRDDGTVRYNYTHAKHILEIFRLLCSGKNEPYNELCICFNAETKSGADMTKYAGLLKRAADETARVFKRKGSANLVNSRDALLIPDAEMVSSMDDFELVTWLVIK